MNQNDKIRNALVTVTELTSRISTLERNLADVRRLCGKAKSEIVRVLKATGQRQVLFRGQVYARGTGESSTTEEGPQEEFLTINKFTGLVLPDGNGAPRGVQDPVSKKEE